MSEKMKDKDKYYGGNWCLKCGRCFPDKNEKKWQTMLCIECTKKIRIDLEEMNKNGVYLKEQKDD